MSNTIDTNSLLLQLRRMAQDAGIPATDAIKPPADSDVSFNDLLTSSLSGVNDRQQVASELRSAFEAGQPDLELSDVMIAVQKARISFEALSQVRNKMVSAYKDIMNMPSVVSLSHAVRHWPHSCNARSDRVDQQTLTDRAALACPEQVSLPRSESVFHRHRALAAG